MKLIIETIKDLGIDPEPHDICDICNMYSKHDIYKYELTSYYDDGSVGVTEETSVCIDCYNHIIGK